MLYPEAIQNLIECYKKLPGIGEKTAERMALYSLDMDQETLIFFADALNNVKTKIKRCSICGNYSEEDLCSICNDKKRDKDIICVVEEPKNIFQFEKIGSYNGQYHVLNGLISPLDNINPDDLNVDSLIKKIDNNDIKEVILAVKPSIEGETTTLYISKLLEKKNIIVSKIAHGVPIGADMDYVDSLTLEMALEDRKVIPK